MRLIVVGLYFVGVIVALGIVALVGIEFVQLLQRVFDAIGAAP